MGLCRHIRHADDAACMLPQLGFEEALARLHAAVTAAAADYAHFRSGLLRFEVGHGAVINISIAQNPPPSLAA